MAIGSPQWMYASGEDFTIDQSLRFNDDDSAYLSKTPSSAGNLNKWTWSGWVKRGNLTNSSYPALFGAYISSSVRDVIRFTDTDELSLQVKTASATYTKTSDAKYRDPSAWLHIIVVWDSANATASHRLRMYVNGSEITLTGTDVASGSPNSCINSANSHFLGARSSDGNPSAYHDGYLAEAHFIDGQALTPSSFGETGDYGEWKPKAYSGTYGTNGFYLNFAGGGVMSATGGNSTATDGDYKAASFTSNGTFTPSVNGYVEYLVIAGGGGGGGGNGGGGGAGGYRTGYLAVTGSTAYSITVGDGGTAGTGTNSDGGNGENSVFSSITSTGGGGGGAYQNGAGRVGLAGGSGGGAGSGQSTQSGGSSTSGQGNDGGDAPLSGGHNRTGGGGGGGAGSAGSDGSSGVSPPDNQTGGNGGSGLSSSITGSSVTRAGGGAGRGQGGNGSGGSGGGGNPSTDGTANTGSGGGAGAGSSGAGGSGIVIIRYKFQ